MSDKREHAATPVSSDRSSAFAGVGGNDDVDIASFDSSTAMSRPGNSSSVKDGSTRSVSVGGKNASASKILRNSIIKKEERAVRRARLLVFFAIILAAVCVSFAVYVFSSRGDYNSFVIEVRLLGLLCTHWLHYIL